MDELLDRLRDAVRDRYDVERIIGSGGMGQVFVAHDLRIPRQVAIKVLPPELAYGTNTDRFLDEVDIHGRLEHSRIVRIYDQGFHQGLLYYVMRYVDGESLRSRLDREPELPVEEAISIAVQVADALEFAHGHGIIHRDIKPGNILLSGKDVLVADFGIAKARDRAGGSLTKTHRGLGTAGYMSPEQMSGARTLDGRADQYGLACVLFEMLAGEPLYRGTPQAIFAKQLRLDVPPVSTLREPVSYELDQTILRALARSPADRFPTITEFREALEVCDTTPLPHRPRRSRTSRTTVAASFLISILLGASAFYVMGDVTRSRTSRTPPDSSQYAVLPFAYGLGASDINESELIRDALSRWQGVRAIDPMDVRSSLPDRDPRALSNEAAAGWAASLGAGRFFRGEVSRTGDSLRVRVGLYDASAGGELIADHVDRLSSALAGIDSLGISMVDRLLFGDLLEADEVTAPKTSSFRSRTNFLQGRRALEAWDLSGAEERFRAATIHDPSYARGHLWLALTRAWGDEPLGRWALEVEQAALGRASLTDLERGVERALASEAADLMPEACEAWQELSSEHPDEFVAWYGWARCLSHDETVVVDNSSPSGWSFRTSYQQALVAYRRAFIIRPAVLSALSPGSFEPVRSLLFTSGDDIRNGVSKPPNPRRFGAFAGWRGDTLSFVPRLIEDLSAGLPPPESGVDAALNQRRLFRDIAQGWAASEARSGRALEALGIALAMLGDESALDTLREAAGLAEDWVERTRISTSEVWLRLRSSLPGDLERVTGATTTIDSLLNTNPDAAAVSNRLASLAALRGRIHEAARLGRLAARADLLSMPPGAASAGPPMLLFATVGGPIDSLIRLDRELRASMAGLAPADRELSERWQALAVSLAYPAWRPNDAERWGTVDRLIALQNAASEGRKSNWREEFQSLRDARRGWPPEYLPLDAILPETRLLAVVAGPHEAAGWLNPKLESIRTIPLGAIETMVSAAALVPAMVTKADLEDALGNAEEAAVWARAVVALWGDADSFLQPVVTRMRRLAT